MVDLCQAKRENIKVGTENGVTKGIVRQGASQKEFFYMRGIRGLYCGGLKRTITSVPGCRGRMSTVPEN